MRQNKTRTAQISKTVLADGTTKRSHLNVAYPASLVNPYPANVENMVSSNNANKGQMGFNSALKGLK
jgi:hypothetical protein